jgi:hypothetical protein
MSTARSRWANLRSQVAEMPIVARFAVVGSVTASLAGGVIGLVLGLLAHPPTAWFAILEVGVPAGGLGAAIGALVGVVAHVARRLNDP